MTQEYQLARRELLSTRVRKGMAEAAADGRPTGIARLGYVRLRIGHDGTDPERCEAVARAWAMAVEGSHSLRGIHREMLKLGLTGTRGGAITLSSLRHMLRDSHYAGLTQYKGVLRKGSHPAYVTLAEFNLIQKNMGWLENQIEHPYQE
jgi:hypothetical protein